MTKRKRQRKRKSGNGSSNNTIVGCSTDNAASSGAAAGVVYTGGSPSAQQEASNDDRSASIEASNLKEGDKVVEREEEEEEEETINNHNTDDDDYDASERPLLLSTENDAVDKRQPVEGRRRDNSQFDDAEDDPFRGIEFGAVSTSAPVLDPFPSFRPLLSWGWHHLFDSSSKTNDNNLVIQTLRRPARSRR